MLSTLFYKYFQLMFIILITNFLIFTYGGENDFLDKSNQVLAWIMLPIYQLIHLPIFVDFWEYVSEEILNNIEYFDHLTLQEL